MLSAPCLWRSAWDNEWGGAASGSRQKPLSYELWDLGQVTKPLWACFACKMTFVRSKWDHVRSVISRVSSTLCGLHTCFSYCYRECYPGPQQSVCLFIYSGGGMRHRAKKYLINMKKGFLSIPPSPLPQPLLHGSSPQSTTGPWRHTNPFTAFF